jgi:hypothetical protein
MSASTHLYTHREIALAVAVAEEFDRCQKKREEAGGEAAHRKHEGEPAEVGVRALVAGDATEAGKDERGSDGSGGEYQKAGAEELAGIWLHRGSDGGSCFGS